MFGDGYFYLRIEEIFSNWMLLILNLKSNALRWEKKKSSNILFSKDAKCVKRDMIGNTAFQTDFFWGNDSEKFTFAFVLSRVLTCVQDADSFQICPSRVSLLVLDYFFFNSDVISNHSSALSSYHD